MSEQITLPFGKYKGAPLSAVPSGYLLWLLREVKLSSGLRSAVGAALAKRGVDVPPAPALLEPELPCLRCGGEEMAYSWSTDRTGRRQLRRTCSGCSAWCGFAPQREPFTSIADE